MKTFEIGDKVVVYGNSLPGSQGPWSGVVVELRAICLSYDIQVRADYMGHVREVHSKQCRKLKPGRKAREWTVTVDENNNLQCQHATRGSSMKILREILVKEVLPKRSKP